MIVDWIHFQIQWMFNFPRQNYQAIPVSVYHNYSETRPLGLIRNSWDPEGKGLNWSLGLIMYVVGHRVLKAYHWPILI